MYEPEREKRFTRLLSEDVGEWVLILVSTLSNLAKLKISRLVPLTVIFGQDQDLQRWTSSALTSWQLLFSHYKTGLPGMSKHVLVTCKQTPIAMGQRRIEYWSWWRSELECILTGIAKLYYLVVRGIHSNFDFPDKQWIHEVVEIHANRKIWMELSLAMSNANGHLARVSTCSEPNLNLKFGRDACLIM